MRAILICLLALATKPTPSPSTSGFTEPFPKSTWADLVPRSTVGAACIQNLQDSLALPFEKLGKELGSMTLPAACPPELDVARRETATACASADAVKACRTGTIIFRIMAVEALSGETPLPKMPLSILLPQVAVIAFANSDLAVAKKLDPLLDPMLDELARRVPNDTAVANIVAAMRVDAFLRTGGAVDRAKVERAVAACTKLDPTDLECAETHIAWLLATKQEAAATKRIDALYEARRDDALAIALKAIAPWRAGKRYEATPFLDLAALTEEPVGRFTAMRDAANNMPTGSTDPFKLAPQLRFGELVVGLRAAPLAK